MSKRSTTPCYGTMVKYDSLINYIMYSTSLGLKSRAKRVGLDYELNTQNIYQKAIESPNAQSIFDNFVKSRKTSDALSVDRINPKIGYLIDNIQFLSFGDNERKRRFDNLILRNSINDFDLHGLTTIYTTSKKRGKRITRYCFKMETNDWKTFINLDDAKEYRNKYYSDLLITLLNKDVKIQVELLPEYLQRAIV